MGCRMCPRECGADRTTGAGRCGAGAEVEVAAICLHRGEEPPIAGPRGIVNVFFAHCGLQCIYCQNRAIATRDVDPRLVHYRTVEQVADRVAELLPQSSGLMGLVTAGHYADRLPQLVATIRARGANPTVVYNSSGYEAVDTLRSLEGLVDIYLPDLKYMDTALAAQLSHAPDYPQRAAAALKEMYRQVGSGLMVQDGVAYRGMLVRHLVLPGCVDNSVACLDWLADNLPANLHLSLMAQYYPPTAGLPAPLDRTVSPDEYLQVVDRWNAVSLGNGFTQDPSASTFYRPDFTHPDNPFE